MVLPAHMANIRTPPANTFVLAFRGGKLLDRWQDLRDRGQNLFLSFCLLFPSLLLLIHTLFSPGCVAASPFSFLVYFALCFRSPSSL